MLYVLFKKSLFAKMTGMRMTQVMRLLFWIFWILVSETRNY